MKFAHLADLHLGFRQYTRQTPQGINQREADVAGAFRRATDQVIEAAPDLVLVAGDLFHSVRPTNAAILDSFNQFRRLRAALPETPVVIVAGNHDTPRSTETGTILKLFAAVDGVQVVVHAPERLVFERLATTVLCVPNLVWSASPRPSIAPDASATRNILVTHREVEGMVPRDPSDLAYGGVPIRQSELRAEEFDYVALGHHHVANELAPNVWYSGALEYVTTNPWGESRERGSTAAAGDKGWLLVELGERLRISFQRVEPARRVVDLDPISAAGCAAADLDRAIAAQVEEIPGGIDGQIVRQVVYDVPRTTARDLDHAAIRAIKASALHYRLDLRRPTRQRDITLDTQGRRQTLSEIVTDYLGRRPLPAGVSRDRLLALGAAYLDAAEREMAEE